MTLKRMKNEGRICLLDGCELPAKKRGYCGTHYRRFRRHGDASVVKKQGNKVLHQWLLDHKAYDGDECLIWPFTRSTDGRGQITINGKNRKAPRVMCRLAHGDPPHPSYHAAHTCGNGHGGCVNPRHLRWKTKIDNERDKITHGTLIRGEKHPAAKLTKADVIAIRSRLKTKTCKSVAEAYNLHPGTVSQIKRRVRWKHV